MNTNNKIKTVPDGLQDKIAIDEWKRVLNEIENLNSLDMYSLIGYCNSFSSYIQATKRLKKEGLLIYNIRCERIKNPLIEIQMSYARECRDFAEKSGISMNARMKSEDCKNNEIPWDIILKGR